MDMIQFNRYREYFLKSVAWITALIGLFGIFYSVTYNSEHVALLAIAMILFAIFMSKEI